MFLAIACTIANISDVKGQIEKVKSFITFMASFSFIYLFLPLKHFSVVTTIKTGGKFHLLIMEKPPKEVVQFSNILIEMYIIFPKT